MELGVRFGFVLGAEFPCWFVEGITEVLVAEDCGAALALRASYRESLLPLVAQSVKTKAGDVRRLEQP